MKVEKLPKKENGESGNNEDYLETTIIGAFGAWRAKICILVILSRFLAMWNMLNIMFPTCESSFTCAKFNASCTVNVTPSTCYSCIEYEFVKTLFVKGFVSEFGLISERVSMASFVQTILMFGLLFRVFLLDGSPTVNGIRSEKHQREFYFREKTLLLDMDAGKLYNEERGKVDNEDNEDYLVKTIGAFGAWQAKVCILATLTRFLAMWNMLNIMFLTYDSNFTCAKFSGSRPVNVTSSTCYDDCVEYAFEEGLFVNSFASEFGLICENAWMASFAQTILMFGLLFGVSLFGWISDRFGRRKAIFSSAFLVVILMLSTCFATDYWVFCVLRFFTGAATGGTLIVSIVIVLEVVGPQYRELAGCGITLPDGLAEASLVAFVQFSPTWRVYLLSMGGASALIMVFLVLLPESPRWLMSKGRLDEARALMTQAAKCNNLDLSAAEVNINSIMPTDFMEKATTTYCDLFRTRKLFTRTVCSLFLWMVVGMCYFGINQYCTFLGMNVFVSVIIMGLMQIPAAFVATWLNKVYGRKATIISNLIITGLTMFLLIFTTPDHWAALTLGIIGLWADTITFNVLYVFVSELFPTPLRNMGYGVSSSGAKVGAMIAPFIANLSPHWIPSLIFSALAFLGAGVCCALPETKGCALEDNLDHAD